MHSREFVKQAPVFDANGGMGVDATYSFKHALIQDAAYQSLLKNTRQQFHRQVAKVLREQFASQVDAQPEVLAHHLTQAGEGLEAAPFWTKAGQRALARSAAAEAIRHYSQGLEALSAVQPSAARDRAELDTQMALGTAYIHTKGWSSLESKGPFVRAHALCTRLGDVAQRFRVIYANWAFNLVMGNEYEARRFCDECLALVEQCKDNDLSINAQVADGHVRMHQGEFPQARASMETAIKQYGAGTRPDLLLRFGRDPKVSALQSLAFTLACMRFAKDAFQRSRECLEFARTIKHPFMIAWGHCAVVMTHMVFRSKDLDDEQLMEGIRLCEEQRFPYWLGVLGASRGARHIQCGSLRAGIEMLEEGLRMLEPVGSRLYVPLWRAGLAGGYREAGELAKAMDVLDEAQRIAQGDGQFAALGEISRVRADVLLDQGAPVDTVEARYRESLALSIRTQARTMRLRVTNSLAALLVKRDRVQEALRLLDEASESFAEADSFPDLSDARALRASLSR